ncbi:MAG: hypothetical protein GY913_36315, partial [Proteobacteria bacterium]|nr:hypothetical protein [Pseudomonadota bacterium]
RWTSAATPDAFEQFARGRAHFRLDDLMELAAVLQELSDQEAGPCVKLISS